MGFRTVSNEYRQLYAYDTTEKLQHGLLASVANCAALEERIFVGNDERHVVTLSRRCDAFTMMRRRTCVQDTCHSSSSSSSTVHQHLRLHSQRHVTYPAIKMQSLTASLSLRHARVYSVCFRQIQIYFVVIFTVCYASRFLMLNCVHSFLRIIFFCCKRHKKLISTSRPYF